MHKGITDKIEAIIDRMASMSSLQSYILCGGTALSMQIDHRKSEDLDFMMWRKSKTEKPQIDWPTIEQELVSKIGKIESFNILGFDQVEFLVDGVKLSFYVSNNLCPVIETVPYLGNIRLADPLSILAMKIEVMVRRMKFRDYYDIYSILQEGYDIKQGLDIALKYCSHRFTTKNFVLMLLGGKFIVDDNLEQLSPRYNVTTEQIRDYILEKLQAAQLV